ncbi:type VII secretion target [Mycobacteroides abscessus]|uniref:type VII secretion target n=1 Tax=Mycobacteroides abscessus TaxID=36809 RepID=UPI0021071223|nr:type VII secretion target [Mycobacteroides abscessus]
MSDRLSVNPDELVSTAATLDARSDRWQRDAANPPHDPDLLAAELGFAGYATVCGLRARNAGRTRDAEAIAGTFGRLATGLRASAQDYRGTDDDGANRVTGADFSA